jgi:hypothetical protein
MRCLVIGAMSAILLTPAFTQNAFAQDQFDLRQRLDQLQKMEQQRKEEAAQVDKAYQQKLKSERSNAPAAKTDPWGNIRASDSKDSKPKDTK